MSPPPRGLKDGPTTACLPLLRRRRSDRSRADTGDLMSSAILLAGSGVEAEDDVTESAAAAAAERDGMSMTRLSFLRADAEELVEGAAMRGGGGGGVERVAVTGVGDVVVGGAPEEDVGGEHGEVHGSRLLRGTRAALAAGVGPHGRAAERAGVVGMEPHVDALDVESMVALGQHPHLLAVGHLGQAHRALERLLAARRGFA